MTNIEDEMNNQDFHTWGLKNYPTYKSFINIIDDLELSELFLLFVKIADETVKNIHGYMDKHLHGFKKHDDLHVTIIYSKKPMDVDVKTEEYSTKATFIKFSLFGEEKNTLVAEISCPKLQERNKELTKKYNILGLPTIIIFDFNQKEIKRYAGFLGPEKFIKFISDIESKE